MRFGHLVVRTEILAARIAQRRGHFMPATMLASQLEALEPLEVDESGAQVDAGQDPAAVADAIVARVLGVSGRRGSRP